MKLVTFESNGENRVGALKGNFVVDLGLARDLLRSGTLGVEQRPELQKAVNAVLAGGVSLRHMIDLLERGKSGAGRWRRFLMPWLPLKDLHAFLKESSRHSSKCGCALPFCGLERLFALGSTINPI